MVGTIGTILAAGFCYVLGKEYGEVAYYSDPNSSLINLGKKVSTGLDTLDDKRDEVKAKIAEKKKANNEEAIEEAAAEEPEVEVIKPEDVLVEAAPAKKTTTKKSK